MAKYIGTYATSGDVQTAINNQELSRPFVAYTTDEDKVYYGAVMAGAEVGDIVVYSTADTLLHYIKQANYNTTSYPVADYVPVGIVAHPQNDDIIAGPSGEITFMGLNWLATNSPDSGMTTEQSIAWGGYGFDIPELTNYTNSGTAITDMNGKDNTSIVLAYATGQTDWKTASAISTTNTAGYYPLFECAWRYHTPGTVQGDWYVPACGQLYYLQSNTEKLAKLNAGFTAVGAGVFEFQGKNRGTSTESSSYSAWGWGSGFWGGNSKNSGGLFRARPFSQALMTAL